MGLLRVQGMREPTQSDYDTAEAMMLDWAGSGNASNRLAKDDGNRAIFTLALILADEMTVGPASLADRRQWVRDGHAAVTADWDALVIGASRPDQKCQRRLMSALALRTGRAVRLDWVNVDKTFWIVRTR